ncbi:TOM1-like protein 5 isoform X1 [Rhododendron vialii]|uniref:TOM1-like protein 5 isoform X1 n=1 Tax=Rhododendron vialii TaxID=182163 RepID=UPI00265F3873|nr:TOM1-like protein 5 isoform X1 [Rhododendron vialii]
MSLLSSCQIQEKQQTMAAALVDSATSEKLTEMDWAKNIEICELVAHDQRQARGVIKAIKKRLGSKNSNTQLFAVMLLEMLMNNIGDHVHRQVIDTGLLSILLKIVKKKSDSPVREKIFLLLDATQTSLGGSGKFPQYYSTYYDLVSAGVQFPPKPDVSPSNNPTSNAIGKHSPSGEPSPSRHEKPSEGAKPQDVPESSLLLHTISIIQKAGSALEVLREVLDAVDLQHPEGAKDEFTLDLVEQCSFQKQRVMHLVMTSRDEKVVSRAIDLNEQLQRVLARHDVLISSRSTSTSNDFVQDEAEEEEEEAEQLFRRMRKGKACARPEHEEGQIERPLGVFKSPNPGERVHHLLIRPLSQEGNAVPPVVLPPPPAKHIEREKFFLENKLDGSATLAPHIRNLSLHSHNGSSSNDGGSMDSD